MFDEKTHRIIHTRWDLLMMNSKTKTGWELSVLDENVHNLFAILQLIKNAGTISSNWYLEIQRGGKHLPISDVNELTLDDVKSVWNDFTYRDNPCNGEWDIYKVYCNENNQICTVNLDVIERCTYDMNREYALNTVINELTTKEADKPEADKPDDYQDGIYFDW